MILRILTGTFLLLSGVLTAQVQMSASTKHDLSIAEQLWKTKGASGFEELSGKFPVYRIKGEYIISLIAKTTTDFNSDALKDQGIVTGSRTGNIATLKVPLDKIHTLYSLTGVSYLEVAEKVRPLLDRAVKDTRADSVHRGIDLPAGYTGKNVYIGVTDWGFDYTHPMYYDTAMTNTRIAAAWDQYRQSGTNPQGFNYGAEFSTPAELLAAGSDTANIYSYAYHGSHVAGIAGGGGAGTNFRGVAFEAEFLFATFLIDAGAVLDAYQWMSQKAAAAGKRLVINQSWGLHYIGNLDGTSLLSQAIDNYSAQGVVFATSGGNNGDVNFHIRKNFNNDTLKTKVDFYNYNSNTNMWGQSLTLWGEPSKSFSVAIKVVNNTGSVLGQSIFYNTSSTPNYIDTFLVIGSDTVFYNISAELANPLNQRPHVRFRIKNRNTALRVALHVAAFDGTVHIWNVTELTNGVGNWGMPLSSIGAGYTAGDTHYGIGEPACTNSAITVAAHSSEYTLGNGSLAGGIIASFSSFGPTLDERVKPDISAPGVSVCSAVSSFTDNSFSTAATIQFEGQDYKFTRISGTSMSSPMVTGVIALILDANPTLMPDQIKDILKQTARVDSKTGVIPTGGSLRWGSGKVNAYDAVKLALNTVSTQTILPSDPLKIYPNPTTGVLFIKGELKGSEKYELFSTEGKLLLSGELEGSSIDLSGFKDGIYLLRINIAQGIRTQQIIKF